MKHIFKILEINWYVTDNGKLVGAREADGFPIYEFWIANPPAPDSIEHALFVSVCDFAVAQGILRKIHTYALVDK